MFPKLPKRIIAIIQVWVSLLLVVLALIMSFMPIVNISITSNLKDDLNEFLSEEGANINMDTIPDEVSVTAPKLISSAIFFFDIASALMDDGPDADFDNGYNNGYNNNYNNGYNDSYNNGYNDYYSYTAYDSAYDYSNGYNNGNDYYTDGGYSSIATPESEKEDISDILENEANRDDLLTAFAFASVFMDAVDEDSSDDVISMVFTLLVTSMALLYLLVMTIVFPIVLIVLAIISLVVALTNLKTPEKAAPKLSSKLTGLLTMLFMVLLFQCAIPQISYGGGALGMLIVTIISIVLNSVAVRLPAYRKEDMKFANIVQGISLVGIVGFVLFFFNLIKTGILSMFLKGPFFTFINGYNDIQDTALGMDIESNYIIDVILMVLYVAFAVTAITYIAKVTRRFSLSAKNHSHLLAYPILALPVFVLPTVIMASKNLNMTVNGTDYIVPQSSLALTDDQSTALTLALVGIIVMLLAEVAYIVLPKVLCKDMTADDKLLVLSGKAPDPNAIVEAPADETVADENVTEEAPADEAATGETTEEATTEEEAPVEEAPAEETPAEETPAEETTEETPAE